VGWGILVGAVLIAFAVVWRFAKLPRYGLELAAAAVLIGVAGYAWLGNPTAPGTSIATRDAPDKLDPELVKSRQNMMGQFGTQAQWLDYADTMTRMGQTQMAVLAMRSGIRDNPRDPDLWVGLGNALVAHGGGLVSPAARFAYGRAAQLSPNHPGPPFFLGVALAQEGKADEAATMWRALLARSPKDAPWRADLENRLAAIEGAAP
jgi:cytochrome c-type biogenesis protein CcmH